MQVARFWRTKEQRYRLQGVKDERYGIRLDKKGQIAQDSRQQEGEGSLMPVMVTHQK
jgi:hypothetical protein